MPRMRIGKRGTLQKSAPKKIKDGKSCSKSLQHFYHVMQVVRCYLFQNQTIHIFLKKLKNFKKIVKTEKLTKIGYHENFAKMEK